MFSSKALASSRHFFSICWLASLCLVLVPQLASAQTGGGTSGSNEVPPPLWYRPGPVTDDQAAPDTFLCRTTLTDGSGELYCAGEVGLGDRTPLNVASGEPSLFTFDLDTHETVRLESAGALDTFGELLDASGGRLASNDNGADGRNFRMTRTLGPGRYYVKVTGADGAEGPTTLLMERTIPRHRGDGQAAADLSGDVGNHCGNAVALAASGTTLSAFDRPGDVDVFAVELVEAGRLLVDVEGGARYELKAADCATSLGVASARLGATLTELSAGTYYLYVSQEDASAEKYQVSLELW